MLKNNIKWLKKNLPGDLKIWKELISEIDWKDFKDKQANKLKMDKQRVKEEVHDFMALSPAEKWDRVINGERQLGRLYQKGSIAFTRREWKGRREHGPRLRQLAGHLERHDKDGSCVTR